MWDLDPDTLTAPLPTVFWIELTSKCPFDCIFCSRKLLRGAGEDMPFELYNSLIEQLESPEIIRLNYSGESTHYPHLTEAIELAHAKGATTELVSAFASIPLKQLEAVAAGPLDRLSISLHTMDPAQFGEIYRFSSLKAIRSKLDQFMRVRNGRPGPLLDFAFVAMERNLEQLGPVASLASEMGVPEITIHPVLRRDPIPFVFAGEVDGFQQLQPGFRQRVLAKAEEVSAAFPDLRITLANPNVHPPRPLMSSPQPHPGELPAGARIRSCEQNPWQTLHVLANGDVVACEVHDKSPLGNLARERLRDVWHSQRYGEFRRAYHRAELPACRSCPWKVAYRPGPLLYWISGAQGASPQLLEGWYAEEPEGIVWSERRASAVIASRPGARALRLRGFLPPDRKSGVNRLDVWCNAGHCGTVENSTTDVLEFDRTWRIEQGERDRWDLRFQTAIAFRGPEQQWNQDPRALGFALAWLQSQEQSQARSRLLRRVAAAPFAASVYALDFACGLARKIVRPRSARAAVAPAGVSVVIPERGNPALLERCLQSIARACRNIDEPHETIVVVNGSPFADYAEARARIEQVHWIHIAEPIGFSAAVRAGAAASRHGWIYLANNDMELAPDCLKAALALRAPDVFAVASQILPADTVSVRQETNWTDFHFANGVIEIFDVAPEGNGPRGSFYAGGGSSLFRADLLREFAAMSEAYDPFYWEDVEWAVRARKKYGLRVVFSPGSRAVHVRRATISRFYPAIEVDRIFHRNAFLYQLRNVTAAGSRRALFEAIACSDWSTCSEILRRCRDVLRARALSYRYAADDRALENLRAASRAEPGEDLGPLLRHSHAGDA